MTMPSASAVSVSAKVSQIPAPSSARLFHTTEVSNAISGSRAPKQTLDAVGQRAQEIAERQVDGADGGERLDRLESVVADAQRDRHQLADGEQGKHRACLEIAEGHIGERRDHDPQRLR